jgi:glyoxylate/hydroxypyruvate reductase A
MSTILLAIQGWEPNEWLSRFRLLAGERDVVLWPDKVDSEKVDYACVWKQPPNLLATFPNIKVIFSLGAGVDHLLQDAKLPNVPIVRVVDPDLTQRMVGYVVMHALLHQRQMKLYGAQQKERHWREHYEPPQREMCIGIMGMGVMGKAASQGLRSVGFPVAGWSRSAKQVTGVEMFSGDTDLDKFLARSTILVCLLPLTPQTKGILRYDLFKKLARGGLGAPFLINAGRGGLQVEDDILRALQDGTLAGASLDVFETEPLPLSSPFWTHPKVYVTPHNAASSDPRALVVNIMAQIERYERGNPLQNLINRELGY